MCDPATLTAGATTVGSFLFNPATAAALTLGGTALGLQQQYATAAAQEKATRNANAASLAAQQAERGRQNQFQQEAFQTWEGARDNLARENHEATREAHAEDIMRRMEQTGAGEGSPMDFISSQTRASEPVKEVIARQTASAAKQSREQVQALANLSAYGQTAQDRGFAAGDTSNTLRMLSGLRQGSLGVSRAEQSIPRASVAPNPWGGALAGAMTGLGNVGSGMAGYNAGMAPFATPQAPLPVAQMGALY